jgi:hypothetical protein
MPVKEVLDPTTPKWGKKKAKWGKNGAKNSFHRMDNKSSKTNSVF